MLVAAWRCVIHAVWPSIILLGRDGWIVLPQLLAGTLCYLHHLKCVARPFLYVSSSEGKHLHWGVVIICLTRSPTILVICLMMITDLSDDDLV